MAQTTTYYNACDASVWLDNDGGTLTDISGSSNSVSLAWTNTSGTLTTFGSQGWTIATAGCAKSGAITLTVVGSTSATEAYSLLHDWFFNHHTQARTLNWYEPNKNIGSHKFAGEVRLVSLTSDRPSVAADPSSTTAELITTGAWTWVTNAT